MTMQAEELKAIRSKLGMTQQAFAEALGMSRKAVNEMEAGKAAVERRTELVARSLGPLTKAFTIGGPSHGRPVWASSFQNEFLMDNPKWMPPFVAPNSPGTSAPTTTYRYSGVTLPESGERIFVPADEEGWDEQRAHREGAAAVAAWEARHR